MTLPTSADDHLKALEAALARGERLKALEAFVEAACPLPEQGWLSRVVFGRVDPEVRVHFVKPFEDGGLLARSRAFWAMAETPRFDLAVLPDGARMSLFAFGPDGYRHLSGSVAAVEGLLTDEGRSVGDLDPAPLARLLVTALGQRGNSGHVVVPSPRALGSPDPGPPLGLSPGYAVDRAEWQRLEARVHEPRVVPHGTSGALLEVCTVFGWMHDKRSLYRLTYAIEQREGGYRGGAGPVAIRASSELLSRRLFTRTPSLRY